MPEAPRNRDVSRRQFLKTAAGTAAGLVVLGLPAGRARAGAARASGADALAHAFLHPPLSARPGAYWVWANGHFDPEQLTRELEDYREKGLSGMEIFDVGARDPEQRVPAGPPFMSPEALEGVRHTIREAGRLGLEMGFITSSSWNAGGPWVTPAIASKTLYHSEAAVRGPASVTLELPYPELPEPQFRGREGGLVPWGDEEVYSKDVAVLALPARADRTISDLSEIVDLTDQLGPGGRLAWEVPAGEWVVLRMVCTNNRERLVLPSPNSDGYMIDHLSAEATEAHFRVILERLRATLGPFERTALKYLYLPSYEVRGLTEWTPGFEEEFRRRRGYDVRPFLPVLFGWTIADPEVSARFDHDRRMTVSDLLVENHYRKAAEVCHGYGLELHAESGGPGRPFHPTHDFPAESLSALAAVDVPRGEHWVTGDPSANSHANVMKAVSCAAHVYGKQVAELEAFTSWNHWVNGPAELKPYADRAFCEGINRFVFHTSPHQPAGAGQPGWSYHAGTHMGRTRVWWPMAGPFISYLARTSAVLQEGLFVADACFYYGHDAPLLIANKRFDPATASLGPGYDYDYVNTDVLLNRMAVREGRLVLPDGMSYAVLVLPERPEMLPEVAERLERLVRDGATVVGPKPSRTPGLYAADPRRRREQDARLRAAAERLWGEVDGRRVTSRTHGHGRVVHGVSLREVLLARGIGPDVTVRGRDGETELDYVHRRAGGRDVYLVCNTKPRWEAVDVVFRAAGAAPELWSPETGERRRCRLYDRVEGGTRVHLELAPHGAVFVVFDAAGPAEHVVGVEHDGAPRYPVSPRTPAGRPPLAVDGGEGEGFQLTAWEPGSYLLRVAHGGTARVEVPPYRHLIEVDGPWTIRFPEGWGAPASAVLPRLASWTEHEEEGIRHFSGIASYERDLDLPEDALAADRVVALDLGEVHHVAAVYLNDRPLGIVWCAPYEVDLTGAAVPGRNRLRVEVANDWANRLIGDRALPPERRFTRTNLAVRAQPQEPVPSGLLGPVRLRIGTRRSLHA